MTDYIYVISNEQGYIKVGVSKHPKKRIKQLQTGNEHQLTLLFTEEFECSRSHLLKIENALHKHLQQISIKSKGEWFYVEDFKLDSIKNTITYYRIRYENDEKAFNRYY